MPQPVIREKDVIETLKLASRLQRVRNSGVEEGSTVPDNWAKAGDNQECLSWESGGYRSKKCIRINTAADKRAQWEGDHFLVKGDTPYRFGLMVKGASGNEGFLTLRFFSDLAGTTFISEQNMNLEGSYSDWTLKDEEMVSPATAVTADLIFKVAAVQVNDFSGDDFFVVEL